jgi:predicted CopG family antitoxin
MNRKAENEFKQLIKLGIPEDTARLLAIAKHNPQSEEVKSLIEEHKEEQVEIQSFINDFKKVE